MSNLRQAGAQLELRLDRCHWAAVDTLKLAGFVHASDVDRERTILENVELQNATDDELSGLWMILATSGILFGAGVRLRDRIATILRERKAN